MLLKVKYQGTKKYIRLQSGFTYLELINEGQFVMSTNILPTVDEDKLHEMIEANPDFCLTLFNSIPGTFLLQHRL
ncbi:unnamed protein product [Arctogadus glacialis]